MSKSFKFIHKVSVVFLCFASLLNQILGDKGQDAKSLEIFPLFASPLHSSHEYLLSTHYVPGSIEHLCAFMGAKSLQSCPSLCDPMDCNAPGSSAYGTFQARIVEWVAIPFSSGAPTICQISGAQSQE